jgi:hypothetical protein
VKRDSTLAQSFQLAATNANAQATACHAHARDRPVLNLAACVLPGYHLVNLVLHVAVSVLMLGLSRRLRPGLPRGALLAALLFAGHPVHTEAVCNTVGRAELLSALLLLVSMRAYSAAATGHDTVRAVAWYAAACVTAVAAAWSKETGLLALVLGAAEDLLHQPPFQNPDAATGKGAAMDTVPPVAAAAAAEAGRDQTAASKRGPPRMMRPQQRLLPSRGWWMRTALAATLTVLFLWDANARRGGKRLTPVFSYVDNPISHGAFEGQTGQTPFSEPVLY